MARIVCDADPFCYGPVATLLTVVKHLLTSGHHITFIGAGTALELAERQSNISVVACNTNSTADCRQALEAAGGADILLSVLGDASIHAANALEIPVAYIDVLFWIWPSAVEEHLRNADLYFIENHFEAGQKLEQLKGVIRNPHLVGPIIDASFRASGKRKNQLLVSYGGVDSMATTSGRDTRYHVIMTQLLLEALEAENPFDQVCVAAGARAIEGLERVFSTSGVQFVSLSHDDFLRQLAASRCLLTQPGLSTPVEAFAYSTPAFFLPPMNYTQVLQLRRFEAKGAAPYHLSWDSLYAECLIPEQLGEGEGITQVLTRISWLEQDSDTRRRIRDRISDFISRPHSIMDGIRAVQIDFFNSLGADGATSVSNRINNFL